MKETSLTAHRTGATEHLSYSRQLHPAEHMHICVPVRTDTHNTLHSLLSTLINISKYSLQNNNKSDPNQIQELGQYNYVYAKYSSITIARLLL
jgi:hypothetical protein